MNRDRITSVVDVAGAAAIVAGAAMLSVAAGWIIGGALMLVLSWRSTR